MARISYPRDKDGKFLSMWDLIAKKKMPPTRTVRYCCSVLKEAGTSNRMAVVGVRSAESVRRRNRDVFSVRGGSLRTATFFSLDHTSEVFRESLEASDDVWDCTLIKAMKQHGDTIVNPIYDWLDCDVWDYIKQEGIKVNPLYEQGYKRIGCIGCPISSYREKIKEFERYPAYKLNYKRAFKRSLDKFPEDREWNSPDDVFDWWIEKYKYEVKGQISLFENDI